jgi:hypothetical protein
MSDLPILKATPRFEKLIALSGPLALTAGALWAVVTEFGFEWHTMFFLAFLLGFAVLAWIPLGLLVTYMNRPFVTLTEQWIAVQPEHQLVKPCIVPLSRCRWSVDGNQKITLRLFPFYYSMIMVGALPHRLVLDLPAAQFDVWVRRLRASGAPEYKGQIIH